MATFKEFIASIQADGNDGKAFEHFCKWFLLNDPYWKSQVDKAWLFSEWPDRWGPDNGIDLIFKHKNGETWAVQAKCYDEKYSVSKPDMDSFLTESNRAVIKHRLLLASTNIMGRNAQRACAGQEKPVTLYLLKDFEKAQVEYPSHISALTSAKPKSKPVPDPHQIRAIDEVVSKFDGFDRGQLIMACGTGKTFTTLWIKEALGAQTTLVLVPSLNLLSQTLNEWAFAAKDSFDALCVCSDKSVSNRDKEDMALSEAPFPVTSELSTISKFISNNGHKVIFCTYQSSDLIAEVQSDKSIDPFDLVIADEAHRCSGKSDAAFSKVLDGEAIRASKRVFTTATPRLYSSSVKKAAADRGIEVYGMDDEVVFGPVLHTLTFGQAIAEDLLNDYQVVIVGVDQPMIKGWIENQELIGVNPDNVTDARTLAAKIGLLKAIKDYCLTRVISFHSRVNAARDFAAEVSELVDLIEPSNRPKGTLWSSYVNGEMPTRDRIIEIARLKSLENADIGVLANARCLSEGVDVPSLNGIAFIDPRGSQVDIIQAVGRAIRKVRDASTQTKGTIVLPVFIEEGDDAKAKIQASNFKPVWDVLKALRSHDEVLAQSLDQYRTNMAKNLSQSRQRISDKIIFDLPVSVDTKFSSALRTVLVEATTESWEFWFGLLQVFHQRKGHCNFPVRYKESGYALGEWAGNQRRFKNKMPLERKIKLDKIGFAWSLKDQKFNEIINYLKEYRKSFPNVLVNKNYVTEDGYALGKVLMGVRKNLRAGYYNNEQKALLSELGVALDQDEKNFQVGFEYAKDFILKNRFPLIPVNHITSDGYKLGKWASVKRGAFKRNSLPEDKVKQLNSIGFVWNNEDELFRIGCLYFEEFTTEFQHARVHNDYKHPDTYPLGNWVARIRNGYKNNKLTNDQIRKLEELGFIFDPSMHDFNTSVGLLIEYKNDHGDCMVSSRYKTKDGYGLGQFVHRIRKSRKTLTQKQIKALDDIGFIWNIRKNNAEE